MSKKYIEVVGEGSYQECPEQVVLDVELSVRSAKEESAGKGNRKIADALVNELLESGLTKKEIYFGGRESFVPWWKRKKAGQETRTKITIISSRRELVYQATEQINRYIDNKRITVEVSERQPVYKAPEDAEFEALEAALKNAREKAVHLAQSASCVLGEVLEIEEWKRNTRSSGSYGDPDWWGDSGAMMGAAGSAGFDDEPASYLQGSNRTVYVKLRVRYEIKPAVPYRSIFNRG
ncbi:SIMPL domain-containing protein [Acaryochloris marina]|uniref:SIMPL domain-containing protein n=1 Tax=Acaryochloris marina TaxID=155978 RepID=UPI001BAF52C6|nr:SIMPL domain-containing protein [Acaryochloris marina]QUY41457.1 SIMPL domain-containing protein [Acaryochloris marina S15]